jgi:ParB family chromosome partitioning protein
MEDRQSAARITAFVRKADEGTIGKLLIEAVILLSARTQADGGKTLRAAAQVYGVDTDAVVSKVKEEFAAKQKVKKAEAESKSNAGKKSKAA